MFFNNIVALHVLVQLLVAKRVACFQFEDGTVTQEGRNLHAGIKDALNHTCFRARKDSLFVGMHIFCVLHGDSE